MIMGLFDFLNQKIALDLGTSNTLIGYKGKIAVNHPSIIIIHPITGKVIAVGREAVKMNTTIDKNIKTIYPFKNGVISNFDASEKMLKTFIRKISSLPIQLFSTSYCMIISIPCQSTNVEMRAVIKSAKKLNAKHIFLVHKPIAAAIGSGLDILAPKGNMIVDIGGGTTEIAIMSLGKIISGKSVKIAGNVFDQDIVNYIREHHNLIIKKTLAEKIKIKTGAAFPSLESPPDSMIIEGRDVDSGKKRTLTITYKEIEKSLDRSLARIENAIRETLSEIPPEISADLYNAGIYLTGGGSKLRGLDKRLSRNTELPIHLGRKPLKAVIHGSTIILKNLDRYQKVLV